MKVGDFIYHLCKSSNSPDDKILFIFEVAIPDIGPHYQIDYEPGGKTLSLAVEDTPFQRIGDNEDYGDPIDITGKFLIRIRSLHDYRNENEENSEDDKDILMTVREFMGLVSPFAHYDVVFHTEYYGMNYELDIIKENIFYMGRESTVDYSVRDKECIREFIGDLSRQYSLIRVMLR